MASQNWCFTSFDKEPPRFNDETMGWLNYQQEFTKKDKLHWQGFVIFNDKLGRKQAQKTLYPDKDVKCNMSVRYKFSTNKAAADYCTWEFYPDGYVDPNSGEDKSGQRKRVEGTEAFEFGAMFIEAPKRQGKRNDLLRDGETEYSCHHCTPPCTHPAEHRAKMIQLAKAGRFFLIDDAFMFANLDKVLKFNAFFDGGDREKMPECWAWCGPTATGKSHQANAMAEAISNDPRDIYRKPAGKWFPNYRGQPIVIINEYGGQHGKKAQEGDDANLLLQMCDKWPLQVEIKGGFVWFKPTHILITSHYNVEDWWPERTSEIVRRFHRIIYLSERIPDHIIDIHNDPLDVLYGNERIPDMDRRKEIASLTPAPAAPTAITAVEEKSRIPRETGFISRRPKVILDDDGKVVGYDATRVKPEPDTVQIGIDYGDGKELRTLHQAVLDGQINKKAIMPYTAEELRQIEEEEKEEKLLLEADPKLKRWIQLHKEGVLTDEEFETLIEQHADPNEDTPSPEPSYFKSSDIDTDMHRDIGP